MADERDRQAGHRLLEQATGVDFRVERSETVEGPDGGEFCVSITLQVIRDPDADFPTDDSGAFGLLFAIAGLSFADARLRGESERDYHETDEFSLSDFISALSYTIAGDLHFDADYVRGRRMKARINARADGSLVIDTTGRGKAVEHWLAKLQGGACSSFVSRVDARHDVGCGQKGEVHACGSEQHRTLKSRQPVCCVARRSRWPH